MISIRPDLDIHDALNTLKTDRFFSKELWQNIQQCKQNFFNYAEDPRNNPYIDEEIAVSWVNLRSRGISPNALVTKGRLNPQELQRTMERNSLIIEVTNSIINNFKYVMFYSGYIFYLIDKNGIILLEEGDWVRLPPFSKQKSLIGLIVDENMMGNSAHMLSMRLKQPVQLLGPEHYSDAFQNNIASATPIFDEYGEVVASLVLLSQPLLNPTWEDSLQKLSLHTLGLITAMGVAIETQIRLMASHNELINVNKHLKQANERLKTAYETLEATISFVDEGLINIDRFGNIIQLNHEAGRILKLTQQEAAKRNILDFINDKSFLTKALHYGAEPLSFEEITFKIGANEQTFILSIKTFCQENEDVVGALIRMVHPDKINTLASLRASSQTRFEFKDIIGDSADFKKAKEITQRFALTNENILLIGESGTGKELFAQAIHNTYTKQGPFVAINCAAMPRSLIESELFGYESGSFTGADRNGKPGKIELANGGTLFLDEIGDMPLEVQAVLLRVLQDKQVMRVGGKRYQTVDFRVVAATNRDLLKMVKEKQFREDLYYRLSVLKVNIPPLRQRDHDILKLCQYFIETYSKRTGSRKPQLSPAAIKRILEYNWPGNVRQLENAIIYAINISEGEVINLDHLPSEISESYGEIMHDKSMDKSADEMIPMSVWEKAAIESTLLQANNSVAQAASILKISKSTLYRKLKEFNINV